MKKIFSILSNSNQYLQPLPWLLTIGLILVLTIWLPLSISKLVHWEGNNFLFHGGIWAVTILMLNAGVNFCGSKATDFHMRPIDPLVIPLVLLLTIAFAFLTEPLSSLQPITLRNTNYHLFGLSPNPLTFILFVILLPLIEEFFFRGILLGQMLNKLSVPKAVIISSFFYSLSQWGNEHLFTAFLLGVISGLLMVVNKSLLTSVFFHIAWNFIIFYTWLDDFLVTEAVRDYFSGWLIVKEIGIIAGIAGIFYLMYKIVLRQRVYELEDVTDVPM